MLSNEKFFDVVSETYDNMISFKDSVEKKNLLLKEFINDKTKSAADLGCGTGIDSISLSNLGLKVTAFDISEGMINKAKQNAERENVQINFINKSITEISEEHFNKYDFVVSLGNSFANLDSQQLSNSIKIIRRMLTPTGKCLIQILNYIPILENQERIINITRDDNFHFVRFYDFEEGFLRFNILKYFIQDPKDYKLISTKIYPHVIFDFEKLFAEAGFKSINYFGGLNKSRFEKETSKDLVIFAEV